VAIARICPGTGGGQRSAVAIARLGQRLAEGHHEAVAWNRLRDSARRWPRPGCDQGPGEGQRSDVARARPRLALGCGQGPSKGQRSAVADCAPKCRAALSATRALADTVSPTLRGRLLVPASTDAIKGVDGSVQAFYQKWGHWHGVSLGRVSVLPVNSDLSQSSVLRGRSRLERRTCLSQLYWRLCAFEGMRLKRSNDLAHLRPLPAFDGVHQSSLTKSDTADLR
jgi:hypothetical protein